jgi:hypothetical protein
MSVIDWMSTDEVRKAFHVPPKVQKEYKPSNDNVLRTFKTSWEASAWIYDIFQKLGYKTMHVMGDTDGILSLPGAWKWIKDRKFKVTKPWSPWLT